MNTLSATTTLLGAYVNFAPPEFHDSFLLFFSICRRGVFFNDNVTTIKNSISQQGIRDSGYPSAILQLLPQPATHLLSLCQANYEYIVIARKLENFNYHAAKLDSVPKVQRAFRFERWNKVQRKIRWFAGWSLKRIFNKYAHKLRSRKSIFAWRVKDQDDKIQKSGYDRVHIYQFSTEYIYVGKYIYRTNYQFTECSVVMFWPYRTSSI